jgi:hypothetical protein
MRLHCILSNLLAVRISTDDSEEEVYRAYTWTIRRFPWRSKNHIEYDEI